MISLQRQAILVILFNLLIGMIGEVYYSPTGYSASNALSSHKLLMEQYEQEFHSETGWGV